MYACDDCMKCRECGRQQCTPYPYCMHQITCDPCYPAGCEDCQAELETEGAL